MKLKKMEQIRNELNTLSTYEVVIFGSYTEEKMRPISDYDIAVITHLSNKNHLFDLYIQISSNIATPYEVHIFELLPIYIQISIIKNYKVIFGDPFEISEYFYIFRKKWEDCKYRILSNQIINYEERERLYKIGNKILAKYSMKTLSSS